MSLEKSYKKIKQINKASTKPRFKMGKKFILAALILLIPVLMLGIELAKRIAVVNDNGEIRLLLSKVPIKKEDKELIQINPGYYFSKRLKINIYVPDNFKGTESMERIILKKNEEEGRIIIERKPKKYNSLEEGIKDAEKNNLKLISISKVSNFKNINNYKGKVYTIDKENIYLYQYLIYVDHYLYSFYTNQQSEANELFELAYNFIYADHQITPQARKQYNFEQLLQEKFLTFENNEIGFSIDYPPEDKPQIFKQADAERAFGNIGEYKPIGGTAFGLVSQVPGAYELYDGFSLIIIYYKNTDNLSLEAIAREEGKGYDKYGTGTKLDGEIIIDKNKGWKLMYCCYAGGSEAYYFATKNNQYFIRLNIFSAGSDKEKFLQVAEKMIKALKFTDQTIQLDIEKFNVKL
jgi:hypothetical protein